ncbi:MAG: hypothetical protein ACYDBQ_11620 [Thermoplasmatota archaeon]
MAPSSDGVYRCTCGFAGRPRPRLPEPPPKPALPSPPLAPVTWWHRLGQDDLKLGTTFLVVGFIAVFLRQAGILAQILVGAPVFEEAFKFGLAMVIVARLPTRSLALRLPAAWLVGASFGVFEHSFSYPDEGMASLAVRTLFHGLSTGLSMVAHRVLSGSPPVEGRWGATLPSLVVHYLNNFLALVASFSLAFASPATFSLVADLIQSTCLALLGAGYVGVTLGAERFRRIANAVVAWLARYV